MSKGKKIRGRIITIVLIVALLAGTALLLYPTVANWWNSRVQSGVVNRYVEQVKQISAEDYSRFFEEAEQYNEDWKKNISGRVQITEEERSRYYGTLKPGSADVMGYIEIPVINVKLPIYHGTTESVLQAGVGHLEWSSLPIGGEGTHSVLSGHRGLPSSRLFTDLPKVIPGDYFVIYILNEVYTYEVDQTLIVTPDKMQDLMAVDGEDYCSLVTCTPYGVNSHRLLVRGHRIDNVAASIVRIEANAVQISNLMVALFIGVPVIVILFLGALIFSGGSKKRRKKDKKKKGRAAKDAGTLPDAQETRPENGAPSEGDEKPEDSGTPAESETPRGSGETRTDGGTPGDSGKPDESEAPRTGDGVTAGSSFTTENSVAAGSSVATGNSVATGSSVTTENNEERK